MRAEDYTVSSILALPRRFVVPLFQRPYVWGEKEWEPLWESIQEVADKRVSGNPVRPHFIGSIVLEQTKMPVSKVDTRQVIDGQQRLTTLQIIMAAIRDICKEKLMTDYAKTFKRLSENHIPGAKDNDECGNLKVWPTNVDREDFIKTMTAGSLAELERIYDVSTNKKKKDCGHNLPNCYHYFYSQINDWLRKNNRDEGIDSLHQAVTEDLVLVVVDLDEGDDPQLIFETMNALGQPLATADLVKNFLFHKAQQQQENMEEIYCKEWQSIDNDKNYWREEIRQGRIKRLRIDLFLAHYLVFLRKEVTSIPHLFGELRDHFNKPDVKAADNIREIRKYADIFKGFDNQPEYSPEAMFFERLKKLDTATVYPVLLGLFNDNQQSDNDRTLFLKYIESFLVRRRICSLTTRAYNNIFADMTKRLSSASFSSGELKDFLLSKKNAPDRWPTDDELKESFVNSKAYMSSKKPGIVMILKAIEQAMRSDMTEHIIIQGELTIEHIMPQEWKKNWPIPEGVKESDRDIILHRYGNLTLVSEKLNPSMSNSDWATKRIELKKHSALAMNRKLLEHDIWDETTIEQRSEEMFNIAKDIWPRPQP